MKLKKNLIRFILIFGLLTVPSTSVYAQDPDGGDIVLFGQNYTVESDETLNGDIALFGGNLTIEEDAFINGDIILFGGNLDIDGDIDGDIALIGGNVTITGEIDGDIVLIGGQAKLTETAIVDGDIAMIGGNLEREEGAEITGNVTNNAPPVFDAPDVPDAPNAPNMPSQPFRPNMNVHFDNPLWEIASAFGWAIVVAAIGMLLMLFMQPQLERAGSIMVIQPFMAGGFGLLVIAVIVLMAITLILIPFAFIAAIIAFFAWLFGMVALGQEVGDRFTKAINQTWAPVLATGFGTFLLVLLTGLISIVPCVGWIGEAIVNLVALGGVAMTWFGTRNATTRSITPTEPPATT
jgi:cytoskeletal protein CcmA (bactofilin family)/uncharacterized membrane protein